MSHFKGHGSAGFGGAMKQLSIGFASRAGKAYIHKAGVTKDYTQMSNNRASQIDFTTSMAIAASAVANYFKIKRLLLILMF